MKDTFWGDNYKKQAMEAAEDLGYGEEVLKKLEAAKTDGEIERIMVTARKGGNISEPKPKSKPKSVLDKIYKKLEKEELGIE